MLQPLLKDPRSMTAPELLSTVQLTFAVQALLSTAKLLFITLDKRTTLEALANVVAPTLALYYLRGDLKPDVYRVVRLAAAYLSCGVLFDLLCLILFRAFDTWLTVTTAILLVRLLVSAAQWVVLIRQWRELREAGLLHRQFYLNCAILNSNEALKSGISNQCTAVGTRHLGRLAGHIVAKAVSEETFGSKVADEMVRMLPESMVQSGIKTIVSKEFQRGNVIVLLVTIQSVDIPNLVEANAGPKQAGRLSSWLGLLPGLLRDEIHSLVLTGVAAFLVEKLPESVASELKEMGGVKVVAEAKTREDEAAFFFSMLRDLEIHE
eukprot:TRINITY_DN48176_c0_g1_i1.p1 TRINITY_DN48176_c0_g1~~TRINITY_DN48176_c0_g1_i1.p1  ORF type:complete len:330 (+),score=48.06 TRINITY_DN48176_c0_g1_i1:25-990(+)